MKGHAIMSVTRRRAYPPIQKNATIVHGAPAIGIKLPKVMNIRGSKKNILNLKMAQKPANLYVLIIIIIMMMMMNI